MNRFLTLLAILVCASITGAHARAQPVANMDYSALVELGLAEFNQGRWPEAREHFRRAHALEPSARTFRAIGNTSFELSDYPETVRSLTLALADTRRPLTVEQRAAAAELIARSETFIGRVEVSATPANASVRVDGQPACQLGSAVLLMAGSHMLRFESDGFVAREEQLIITARSTITLAIALEPVRLDGSARVVSPGVENTTNSSSRAGIVLTSGGGALTLVGVAFLALGLVDANDVERSAVGSRFEDVSAAYDRAPTRIVVGSILAGVGLAASASGIVLAARRRLRDASTDTASLRITAQPTGLSLQGSF